MKPLEKLSTETLRALLTGLAELARESRLDDETCLQSVHTINANRS